MREQEEEMRRNGQENPVVHKTTIDMKVFIKDKRLRDFYANA